MYILAIEGPFIKNDLDKTPADKNTARQQKAQIVTGSEIQAQNRQSSTDKHVGIEESKSVTQAIPPKVNAKDRSYDRIDAVNKRANKMHILFLSIGNEKGRALLQFIYCHRRG